MEIVEFLHLLIHYCHFPYNSYLSSFQLAVFIFSISTRSPSSEYSLVHVLYFVTLCIHSTILMSFAFESSYLFIFHSSQFWMCLRLRFISYYIVSHTRTMFVYTPQMSRTEMKTANKKQQNEALEGRKVFFCIFRLFFHQLNINAVHTTNGSTEHRCLWCLLSARTSVSHCLRFSFSFTDC